MGSRRGPRGWSTVSTPTTHHCIDIGVDDYLFETEIGNHEIYSTPDGWGWDSAEECGCGWDIGTTHHCIDIGVDDHLFETEIGNHEIYSTVSTPAGWGWDSADEGGCGWDIGNTHHCIDIGVDDHLFETEIGNHELYSTPAACGWDSADEGGCGWDIGTVHHYIDIGVDDHLFETEIGNHEIYSTPAGWDAAVEDGNYEMGKLLVAEVAAWPIRRRRRWGKLGPYSWEQKILLVGEGDFSFSASLAVAFGDASNMMATSLNSLDFLIQNYKRAVDNILELTSKNCEVIHGVNATKMENHPQLHSLKFDRIVYNFPHAGFSNRDAPQEDQIRMHQKLVGGFLGNAKKMINDDGQIHITHKCVGFFLKWNLEELGSCHGLRLVEELPFNLGDYPGYKAKFGYGGDANFNWKPAKTYKFELAKKEPVIVESDSVSEDEIVVGTYFITVPTGGSVKAAEDSGTGGQAVEYLSTLEQPNLGPCMYKADQRMLLVGEGDFSFAASLAVAFGDASNLVATSLDSLEFLKKNYKSAESNISELTSRGCKVIHGVDATTMAIKHPQLCSLKFNCIVFNFPRVVFSNPKPPRDAQLSKHQGLIRAFLVNAKQMIRDDGQIHITHQCFGCYLEWNIKMLGSSEGLRLVEESPFNKRDYPGYHAKYGCGGDGSFDCSPAVTYKFRLPSNVPKKKTQRNRICSPAVGWD